jgi:hypothetical protein
MSVIGTLVRILPSMPVWVRRLFVAFSLEVASSLTKLPSAELIALSIHGTVSEDAKQLLWDLAMRRLDLEYSDAPKPPPNGSVVRVLSGDHKGKLATVGTPMEFTPTSVSVLIHFPNKKMAVLGSTEVKEIKPPVWQPIAADNAPQIGSLLWGATVNHDNTDGESQAGPYIKVFDGSKSLDAVIEDGYVKWLNTAPDGTY